MRPCVASTHKPLAVFTRRPVELLESTGGPVTFKNMADEAVTWFKVTGLPTANTAPESTARPLNSDRIGAAVANDSEGAEKFWF